MDGHSLRELTPTSVTAGTPGSSMHLEDSSAVYPRRVNNFLKQKTQKPAISNPEPFLVSPQQRTLLHSMISRQLRICPSVTSMDGCLFRRNGPAMNWV